MSFFVRGFRGGGQPTSRLPLLAQVLTKYRGMVALGTSSGGIYVLMPSGKKEQQG